jgi:murein DD-endopeptidase MepM/ murein hydrolase activator NlpD
MTKHVLIWFVLLAIFSGCKTRQSASVIYKIKIENGDTLADIARKYDTTWQEIVRLNKMEDVRTIAVGQVIRVRPGPAGYVAGAVSPDLPKTPASTDQEFENQNADVSDRDSKKQRRKGGLLFGKSASGFTWPVKGRLSSKYGPRWGRMHKGVDISARRGTSINAASAGRVIFVGWKRGYGKTVIIEHKKLKTLYAHCSKILVNDGDYVELGQKIGKVGATGNARGAHLHFEVQNLRGRRYNPMRYLPSTQYLSAL